jgi:LPS sulfotransferase NodH
MRRIIRRTKNLLQGQFLALLGSRDYKRFMVVGHARTGSNFLLAGLKQIDSIRIHHEVFGGHNRVIGENFQKIYDSVYRKYPSGTAAVGFKLFYYHLTEDEWNIISDNSDLLAIHLLRRNRLRTLTSLDIALASNEWAIENERKAVPNRISLNTHTLLDRIRKIESSEEDARNRLKSNPYTEIAYEELILSPEKEFERILKFIGVDGNIESKNITLKRQNSRPLSETIENFDDVSLALSGSHYECYLNG